MFLHREKSQRHSVLLTIINNYAVATQIRHSFLQYMAAVTEVVVNSSGVLINLTSKSVGFLLNSIFKNAKEIQKIARRTNSNIDQCSELNQQIQRLISLLKGQKFNETIDQTVKLILTDLAIFLQKCIEFMNEFTNTGFVKRILNNKNHLDKFNNLHTEFSHPAVDINLSVVLTDMLVNNNQDQRDQQLDIIHMLQLLSILDTQGTECNSSSETSKQVCCNKI
jgi:hypothetical protein